MKDSAVQDHALQRNQLALEEPAEDLFVEEGFVEEGFADEPPPAPTGATPTASTPKMERSAKSDDGSDLVSQLRSTLERAAELTRTLESNLQLSPQRAAQSASDRVEQLESRLAAADMDVKELAVRLVESEHQAERLMNLYVATYQLYSSLTPQEVQTSIAEIAINLLGAERFLLLLQRDLETHGTAAGADAAISRQDCEVAFVEGVEEPIPAPFSDGRYQGGDALVDATLADGVLRTGPSDGSKVLAVVPLRVRSNLVGVLVILKLLDHKPILGAEDRDLLDVLSAHAASALFAAGLFEAKDRKLRTLESLMQLVRGGDEDEAPPTASAQPGSSP